MKKIYTILSLFILALLLGMTRGYSQTTLRAMVLDSASKAPVEFATMSIKYIGETQAKRYALTDTTGVAVIPNAAVGRATVLIECVGYRQHTQVFDVHRGANDLGTVYLNGQNTLQGIVVSASGNQIVVKKDTIEYNASSFKTNETDMLEELLKKLPGVEIDSDGKITQNGKEITKIMIDGKVFFMDDPQLASKNLPAKIIDKVRVVERKSDEARFTGIDDGEEETVLDLSLKRGMADGWIGTVGGGYGTDKRYEGAFMVGRFTPKLQVSFIGNANNTNNRSFNDMAGSMMSVMMSGGGANMMGGGGGGRGGFSWTGNGITASKMLGSNVNYQSQDKKLKVNTSYLFSTSDKDVEETKDRTTILSETLNQNNWSSGKQNTATQGHRFDSEIEYNPTDATSFVFRPYLRVGSGDFDQRNNFYTLRGADSTNRGFNSSFGDNNSLQVGGRLMWRQRLWKPGRTLTFRVNYAFSNNSSDGFNISETNYFNEGTISKVDGIN
ncbi:MAG: carboxypeptidase regulatory-like domain-containing protein, partial [Bacteroidales bacterium]|nr:carboxypeptidase regulatory-like domain-containing protein [Bacteroidales bacterium]